MTEIGSGFFRSIRVRYRKIGVGYLVLPALIYLIVFYLWPMLRMARLSLFSPEFTIDHYAKVFGTPAYLLVIRNTFRIGFVVTIASLALGYPIAYLIVHSGPRVRNIVLVAIILPYFTSVLVRTFSWMILLGRSGVVNQFLMSTRIIGEPLQLIYNSQGVYIGMTHVLMPLMVLSLYSVMSEIDLDLVRVAKSLGASPIRAFMTVFLPLSMPGVSAGVLLVFVLSIGYFITPALMGGLGDIVITQVIANHVIDLLNWEFASALAIILLIATIGVILIGSRSVPIGGLFGIGGTRAVERKAIRIPPRFLRASRLLASTRGAIRFRESVSEILRRIRKSLSQLTSISGLSFFRGVIQRISPLAIPAFSVGTIVFFTFPLLIVFIISFSSARYLVFPPPGFSLDQYRDLISDPLWIGSIQTSLQIAVPTALLATLLGILAALAFVRGDFRGKNLILFLSLSPLIIPSVVSGIAVYFLLVRIGVAGTTLGLIIGHTILALPYAIVISSASLQGVDTTLEQAARSLGATRIRAFMTITLPLIRAGVLVSIFLAFMRSFDELVYALFLGIGQVSTLPLKMWDGVKQDVSPIISAVASIQILLVVLGLILVEIRRRQTGRLL